MQLWRGAQQDDEEQRGQALKDSARRLRKVIAYQACALMVLKWLKGLLDPCGFSIHPRAKLAPTPCHSSIVNSGFAAEQLAECSTLAS